MIVGVQPNRERFLAAIAERISPDRVQALYLFAPMRQGQMETGVAVLAVDPLVADPVLTERQTTEDAEGTETSLILQDVGGTAPPEETAAPALEEAHTRPLAPSPPRPVVLTAQYRHTLKGADRGKWSLEILEQADAPLITVEKVIQGVQQRLDEGVEPERLGADALRAALAEGLWTPPPR